MKKLNIVELDDCELNHIVGGTSLIGSFRRGIAQSGPGNLANFLAAAKTILGSGKAFGAVVSTNAKVQV